jgi:S1-C subfamily serine protease
MNEQHELTMLDAVERYIRGEMGPEERLQFENLRKSNSEVDQLVVEHTLFLQQMNRFAERQQFRQSLHNIHHDLAETHQIPADRPSRKARLVYLWTRYRRVAAIAATIAGITAITFNSLIWKFSPAKDSNSGLEQLSSKLSYQEGELKEVKKDIDRVKDSLMNLTEAAAFEAKVGGTGFLIDGKGLMITNAHIVQKSKNVRVVNNKGQEFRAFVVKLDVNRDVAFIKIDDPRYKPVSSLPYGIRKGTSQLAEPVFTLGFPRDEIVYGEGYLSASTGYRGDTLSCQIAVPANPGNSGGPVFNNRGEVIGILSARETKVQGATFAVQSKYIFAALEDLRKNKIYEGVKLPTRSNIAHLNKVQQVEKIKDFIYVVKADLAQ